jgi:hypothetical protein
VLPSPGSRVNVRRPIQYPLANPRTRRHKPRDGKPDGVESGLPRAGRLYFVPSVSVVASRPMPEDLSALNAFLQEHRRCGQLDGGGDEGHVWMAYECGASIATRARLIG